ncbi:MAG: bifunctional phosphoribosyl-AMP cyclohydrolase/phosphoribosyl-ATP diphosphatase HisIE [Myxococcota bacterium]
MGLDPSALWKGLTPNAAGHVTAVVQHADTGQVLMVGAMNETALRATLENRRVTFWSRSRDVLWEKGESSGNTLALVSIRVDCDADALLVAARPAGPTCHTGTTSCFFRRVEASTEGTLPEDDGPPPSSSFARVFAVIEDRKAGRGMTNADGKSYVRRLLDGGAPKINGKVLEEAGELATAITEESDERVASEAADLFFHAMIGLSHRGLSLDDVAKVFDARFGTSGIDEKQSRPKAQLEPG